MREIQNDAYPLRWPLDVPRTPVHVRRRAQFESRIGHARDSLLDELRRLGAVNVVLSTNIPVRRDGLPYADAREPADPGVAIYFKHRGQPRCMSCDRWDRVGANIRALALTIEALRGIERWGSQDLLDRVFTGFAALPPAPSDWRSVLMLGPGPVALEQVRYQYRELARTAHPDVGGGHDEMARLNAAMEAAERELAGGR